MKGARVDNVSTSNKKLLFLHLSFLVCILLYPLPTFAQEGDPYKDPKIYKYIIDQALVGRDLGMERKIDDALEVFKDLDRRWSWLPIGSLGQMLVYEGSMIENFDFRYQKEFEEAERRNRAAMDKLDRAQLDALGWLMFASSYGLSALNQARHHNWWSALENALKGIWCLSSAEELDPDHPDVKLGIGIYTYWRSVLTRSLWFLPFFSDRRSEGIAFMREGLSEEGIAGPVGKLTYAYAMRQEERWAEGVYFLTELEARFPNNILVRLLSGEIDIFLKHYKHAATQFRKVIEIDDSITRAYFLLGGTLLVEGKDVEEAERQLLYFVATEPEGDLKGRAQYLLSVYYEKRGNKEKSEKYLEDAKILVPDLMEQIEASR